MILRVKMTNFMCHQNFTFEPGQRLTFLSGANGSGKSAVLSAIIFALGGSARVSGRGSTNRDLVRTGQRTAEVEVTMHNGDSDDSYKPEVYGNTVTVVRTVRGVDQGGGGGFKLLDHARRQVNVQRPREEVERMMAAFRIQVRRTK